MSVKTKAQLGTEIDADLADGSLITAATLRSKLHDIVDSYEDLIQEYDTAARNGLSGGSLYEGKKIYNTDNNRLEFYNGTQWMPCSQKNTVTVDCSANPNYPEALVGDQYIVTVAGKIGGASGKSVYVGDLVYCTSDNAGGAEGSVGTSWKVCYSGNSTDTPTRYIEVTLTDTQVKALNGTPIDIIPAPGSGKFNLPISIISSMEYNSAPYATNTNLCLYIDDNLELVIFDLSKTTDWLQITPFEFGHDVYDNKATKVTVPVGNPTAGDSPVKVGIYYKIHTL